MLKQLFSPKSKEVLRTDVQKFFPSVQIRKKGDVTSEILDTISIAHDALHSTQTTECS